MRVMKYALWNNKGGVGKTFLSFVLATEYARQHPESQVVVIDMCPQANVSEILLGGNGSGTENLGALIDKRKTIGGYFDKRISSPHAKTGTELAVLTTSVTRHNPHVPENLFLVAGDPSLELQAQAINQIAVQALPPDAWKNVHLWVKDLQDAIITEHSGRDLVFFIDCNPSFSAYTEQAIVATERLIVPCSPDGSSARAIRNVFQLVYGHNTPPIYQQASFANKLTQNTLPTPKFYLAALNRSTHYGSKPSKSFSAMLDGIKDEVRKVHDQKSHQHFTGRPFQELFADVPDAHTVAVVCASLGMPLHDIKPGSCKLPNGEKTQINPGPLNRYKAAVDKIMALL